MSHSLYKTLLSWACAPWHNRVQDEMRRQMQLDMTLISLIMGLYMYCLIAQGRPDLDNDGMHLPSKALVPNHIHNARDTTKRLQAPSYSGLINQRRRLAATDDDEWALVPRHCG